jgi:hypothetical protein
MIRRYRRRGSSMVDRKPMVERNRDEGTPIVHDYVAAERWTGPD